MSISGFTFVHNAINGGYPIREAIEAVQPYVDEVVIIDAQSDDGTSEILEQIKNTKVGWNCNIRIIPAEWGTDGGETLKRLHAMHTLCEHDTIVHFEADEVFDDGLIDQLKYYASNGMESAHVLRLQIEQNFQRVRWYPELVHRMFKKGSVIKEGHTTNSNIDFAAISSGYLWDITNCFRDNFLARIDQQAKLRAGTETPEPNYMMVPKHCVEPARLTKEQAIERLNEPHWIWENTPLNIPNVLKPLIGQTKYG